MHRFRAKGFEVCPIFRKHLLLDYLCTMASISSIEKDSIATTRALLILPCM